MCNDDQIKRLQKTIKELEIGEVWPDSQLRVEAVRIASSFGVAKGLIASADEIYKFLKGTE